MHRVFPKAMPRTQQSKLQERSIKGWPGGWNAVQSDTSMDTRFLKTARNVVRQANGDMKVRYGSQWLAEGTSSGTEIVDCMYFTGRIVCVDNAGEVFTVEEDGTVEVIWNEAIANALVGTPSGWGSDYTTVDFVPFRTELVIHNGEDKPITVDSAFDVTYLQDAATGSNVNTPIGKYGCVVGNYHCVAGIEGAETTVYISASGTAGTFPGDPDPNDAISIDVGAYAPEGGEIFGIAGFRSYLLVFFETQTLPVLLGAYNEDGDHVPSFPDVLPQFGLVGHRCVSSLPSDIQFFDLNGLANASRNLLSGLFDTSHLSAFVEPAYRKSIGALTTVQRREQCFSVWDKLNKSTILFTPTGQAFVYTFNEEKNLRYNAMTEFETVLWKSACVSALGRVFVTKGMRIYQIGNGVFEGENFARELILDRDSTWANGAAFAEDDYVYDSVTEEVYVCQQAHTASAGPTTFAQDRTSYPTYWELFEGNAIDFEMELPWLTSQERMRVKQLRYTSVETDGKAEFLLELFVDKLIGEDEALSPIISLNLIGEDAPGYYDDAGPYGGGRPSYGRGLYKTPTKFLRLKARLSGSATEELSFIAITFLYVLGRYKR